MLCPGKVLDEDNNTLYCGGHGKCLFDPEREEAVCECASGYYSEGCTDFCPGLVPNLVTGIALECHGAGKCDTSSFKCSCSSDKLNPEDCTFLFCS